MAAQLQLLCQGPVIAQLLSTEQLLLKTMKLGSTMPERHESSFFPAINQCPVLNHLPSAALNVLPKQLKIWAHVMFNACARIKHLLAYTSI